MSSSDKTSFLNLNKWFSSDKPSFSDFNLDNQLVDDAIREHFEDSTIHITQAERDSWNDTSFVGTYIGNGAESREITLGCSFTPKAVIVFPHSKFCFFTNNGKTEHFLGFATQGIASSGITLDSAEKRITVLNKVSVTYSSQYATLNELGTLYGYIAIK